MGGVVSDAKNNSDLIQQLIESGYLSNAELKEALYLIDRGRFLCDFESRAYENRSWRKNGDAGENYYLNPSWVYADVLNALELKKGNSVLNIQSGVGFFGLVASLLVGYQGKFIGVDHSLKSVHYAATRHQNFVHRSTAFDMNEFCEPIYLHGDILKFKPGFASFDKIFCSATITVDVLPFLFTFLKIGGVLVVAIDESLIKCKRIDEKKFYFRRLTSFIKMPYLAIDNGTILDLYPKSPPSSDLFKTSPNGDTVFLEFCLDNIANVYPNSIEQRMYKKFKNELELKPQSLKKLCRGTIRNLLRTRYDKEDPEFKLNYFSRNFMLNYSYELQRIEITHFGLTGDCCLKRVNYSQNNVTSKLNSKFKDYRRAYLEKDTDMEYVCDPKKDLCNKCKIIDQLTKIELMDHEYLLTYDHYRHFLEKRIQTLPLPRTLKKFINYNRSFNQDENFYLTNKV